MSGTIARVIPWESMTARQQAEHLIYCHGFDDTYFGDHHPDLRSKPAVVEAFVSGQTRDSEDSYPHPSARTGWHDSDHESDATPAMPTEHTHDKGAP